MCPITLTTISVVTVKTVAVTKAVVTTTTGWSALQVIVAAGTGLGVIAATKGTTEAGVAVASPPLVKSVAIAAPSGTTLKVATAVTQSPTVTNAVAKAAPSVTEVKVTKALVRSPTVDRVVISRSEGSIKTADPQAAAGKTDADKAVLSKLDKADCPDVGDLTKYKNLVEGVFLRHPEEEVFFRDKFERCLEEAEYRNKHPVLAKVGTAIDRGVVPVLAGAGYAVANTAIEEVKKIPENRKKQFAEQDQDIFDHLKHYKDEDCKNITDIEKFKELVTQTFHRHPAKAVLHDAKFKQCVELAREHRLSGP